MLLSYCHEFCLQVKVGLCHNGTFGAIPCAQTALHIVHVKCETKDAVAKAGKLFIFLHA